MNRKFLIIFIVIILILVASFLSYTSFKQSSETSNLSAVFGNAKASIPPTSTSTVSIPKNIIITQKDNNKTIKLAIDDEILVELGTTTSSIKISNTSILGIIAHMPDIEGVQGAYKAIQIGTTTIESSSKNSHFIATVVVK